MTLPRTQSKLSNPVTSRSCAIEVERAGAHFLAGVLLRLQVPEILGSSGPGKFARVLSNLSLHTIHHILEAQHTWPHCNLVRAAAPCVAHCLQHLHFQEASHENHGPEKAVRNQQEKRILENTCPVLVGQPSGVQ